MLRITRLNDEGHRRTLKLEGKIVGPWVSELIQVCNQDATSIGQLRLELSAVTFIDDAGLNLLQTLVAQGVVLVSCSGLVAELLRRECQ